MMSETRNKTNFIVKNTMNRVDEKAVFILSAMETFILDYDGNALFVYLQKLADIH